MNMTVENITGGVYIYAVAVNWDGILVENVKQGVGVQAEIDKK